ncbi:MAG: 4Fe-4S dicluster domain-containing protein [Prevotellaceae bacterium]|jgi:ferredoxin|nr:4Fe-4S dicluster domain-containing protein [Prevotellaceae bacterium]
MVKAMEQKNIPPKNISPKYISKASLKAWLAKVKDDGRHIYAPVTENGKTNFKRVKSVDEISMAHIQTAQSAKGAVFPRTEKLFSYARQQGDVALQDYNPGDIPDTVVFGLHPCDAAAFKALSGIFNWGAQDKPFSERMQRVTLVGVSCSRSDVFCFCTSVGGHPGSAEGSDILLTAIGDDGYLVEIITDRGQALVEKSADLFEAAAGISKEEHLASAPARFSVEEVQRKMAGSFESDIWKKQSARCIGCGACAFVCPACACFDIQENAKGNGTGDRIRCWDSCGFSLFTLHTSGHNPRSVQSQRWRQRLLHKLCYMPDRLSVRGCTGCGRCSRACPVDMNLAEHLKEFERL